MAGFTPVAWVNRSLPHDEFTQGEDEQSMVSIVEDLLKCRESLQTKSPSYKKLRRRVRSGIYAVLRPNIWKTLSGGDKFLESTPSLFDEVQGDFEYALFTGSTTFFNASYINKYFLTDDGWKKAQEVLAVLSQLHCDVTFCPMLQSLACVVMHFMDKEDCFACIDSLFNSKKHAMDRNVTDYCITAKTFQDALKKWKRPAYAWFKSWLTDNNSTKKQIFFVHWLQWIFKTLDFWTMVHILDQFVLDGTKVFYRIGLILFDDVYKLYKNKGKLSKDELEKVICEVAAMPTTKPSQLLNRAFKITGVSRRVIYELRQRNIKLLRSGGLMLPHIDEDEAVFRGSVEGSSLLSESQVEDLFAVLPRRLRQLCKLTCIFTTEAHGTSLRTLYRLCEREPCTILLIKTNEDEIFGAFLSSPLNERFEHCKSFYGNGETFLFCFTPTFKRYTWCGLKMKNSHEAPSFYQLMDNERLIVGGGGGWGLCVEEDLTRGSSQRCTTFDNEPLTSNSNGEFVCVRVEVWSFKEMGHLLASQASYEQDEVQKTEIIIDDE